MEGIILSSEVDAVVDEFGDITVIVNGDIRLRLSRTAATALSSRLLEAVKEAESLPLPKKKEPPSRPGKQNRGVKEDLCD
jgi:hypothetical protein